MDKGCSNHPESMALAVCGVCQKSICLMCVHEEKDGTFCSEECIASFRGLTEVGSSATDPQAVPAAVEGSSGSVFEEMPEHAAVSHPDPVQIPESAQELPPEEAPAPRPASTKSIGNPCYVHGDIRAKAFCSRCRKPICGLCIIENASGMYCSETCVSEARAARKGGMGVKVAVALVILLGGGVGAAYVLKPELFNGILGGPVVVPPKPDPVKPDPIKPDPVKPDPIKPDPVKPDPIKPDPVKPDPIKPDPIKPDPVKPDPVKLDPVKPVKPEPPKPTILVHPWISEDPGSWFRVRRGANLEDVGLKSRDAATYTLTTQAWSGGAAQTASEKRVDIDPVEIHGEETLEIEGRPYLCEIRGVRTAAGLRKEWSLLTGRHAGAILRSEVAGDSLETTRVWEHSLRVGARAFDCLVVEARHADGRETKTWYCPTYPLRNVKIEHDGVIIEALVDTGEQWGSRPAPK